MDGIIEEKFEEIESEWDRSFGARALKIGVLGLAGLVSSMIYEWAYDKVRDRYENKIDAEEAVPELTE